MLPRRVALGDVDGAVGGLGGRLGVTFLLEQFRLISEARKTAVVLLLYRAGTAYFGWCV